MDIQLPATLGEFFTWFGSNVAIGAVVSWVAAHSTWFKTLTGGAKVAVLLIIATVMGMISHVAVQYVPAGVVADLQPYYQILLNAVVIVFAAQGYNFLVNEREDRQPILIEGLPIEDEADGEGASG